MPLQPRDKSGLIAAAGAFASVASVIGTLYYLDAPNILQQRVKSRKVEPRCYSNESPPSLMAFKTLTQQMTVKETYPLASALEKNIPIYACTRFNICDSEQLDKLQDELYHNLTAGPGVYVMKNFFTNLDTIDNSNKAYDDIIADELQRSGKPKGDHFAKASANSRIWNSFSKHAIQDPESFTKYFSNPWFKVVCDSYLGPGYRITTQVNVVRPGGKAQMPHRDYHLGFSFDKDVVQWPKAVHELSKFLTLQGAVAHTDMPIESGPTRLMPFSQHFGEGYRSYRSQDFIDYFQENHVALPLEKGDALFFSPALFHAAGENVTQDFSRSANLIQISSALGKTMETIDSLPLIEKTYGLLSAKYKAEGMSDEVDSFIRAVADGYPFPTNLDCRPPAPDGMAPESEQQILRRVISERWEKEAAMAELTQMREASSANGKITRQTTVFGT